MVGFINNTVKDEKLGTLASEEGEGGRLLEPRSLRQLGQHNKIYDFFVSREAEFCISQASFKLDNVVKDGFILGYLIIL